MFFGKKTQAELDAAFLKAVGRHKFDKAKTLLTQGANVLAVDAEGNTALHKLAGHCPYEYIFEMDPAERFIDFLISRQLDINALNHHGQNCLFSLAQTGRRREKADWMMYLLTRRGASRYIRDRSGRTLLHAVAFYGAQRLVGECDLSLIDKQDKDGYYPHDIAQAGGYPVLAQDLLAKFEKKTGRSVVLKNKPVLRPSRERAPPPRAVRPPSPPPPLRPCSDPVVAPEDRWFLMTSEEVAHVSVTQALGYKITETFNFHSRTHTKIVHNMETKTDTVIDRSFDECPDKIILEDAYRELVRLEGKADRNSIYGRVLKKDAPGGT